MKYASYVVIAVALSGCVTTAGLVRKTHVSLPLLIGATVADVVVTSVVASQIEDSSTAGSVATGVALTAADVVVGCLIGACSSLRL
jgi:uncharacterized membrane protein AbrB (regulator of aidB expression)